MLFLCNSDTNLIVRFVGAKQQKVIGMTIFLVCLLGPKPAQPETEELPEGDEVDEEAMAIASEVEPIYATPYGQPGQEAEMAVLEADTNQQVPAYLQPVSPYPR